MEPAALAISCYGANIGGPLGLIRDAGLTIDASLKEIKAGWPRKIVVPLLDTCTIRATINCLEVGGNFLAQFQAIVTSLGAGVVPLRTATFKVFKPVTGGSIDISVDGFLLQEATLTFSKDDYCLGALNVEAKANVSGSLTEAVTFVQTAGANSLASDLISVNNISLTVPTVGAEVALKSATLTIATQYKRVEIGYPKVLLALIPVEHTVTFEYISEEFTAVALNELLTVGTPTALNIAVNLQGGGTSTITIPAAVLLPGGFTASQDDWATVNKKFIATSPNNEALITMA